MARALATFPLDTAVMSRPLMIAMIAITTSNSMRVNAFLTPAIVREISGVSFSQTILGLPMPKGRRTKVPELQSAQWGSRDLGQ